MPHQKLLLIMIRVGLITTITTLGWNFPLQEVAEPSCRWTVWDELSEDCKVDIVKWSHNKDIGTLLFSALWWTSYDTPQTPKSWWHPSLDLPTSEGTPVYAINDGEVMNASERAGYGLSITIKHTIEWETIFSNYSHLNEILVKKWDKVTWNSMIGKVGCTWFSISGDPTRCWNHLDFQLTTDKSPSHPYWYGDCKEGAYFDAVQEWLCAEKLRAYTIPPLQFFADHTDLDINYPLIAPHVLVKNKEHSVAPAQPWTKKSSLQNIFSRLRAQNSAILGITTSPTPSSPSTNEVKTEEKELAATVDAKPTTTTPAPLTDKQASIDVGTLAWSWNGTLQETTSYKVITLTVTITDKLWNVFMWTLPQPFKAKIDNTEVGSFFPDQFSIVNTDKKHLFFQTRKPWTATITLRYGETKIGEEKVVVR